MTDDVERISTLKAVLQGSEPLHELIKNLRHFVWDYEGEGAELSRNHLEKILLRFIKEEITAGAVEQWANAIEGREDIFFEGGYEDRIAATVHELANPDLTFKLDLDRAKTLLHDLQGSDLKT